jgi:WD40 repeat protein
VTGGFDRTIRIWDLERGEQRFVLRGHRAPVQAVCFSPDGRRLASGARDGQIRVWESD